MLERLLDSVILVDHFNGINEASTFIASLAPGKTAISLITYAEILVGFEEETIKEVKDLWNYYLKKALR